MTTESQTPSYVKSLLVAGERKQPTRKVWGVDLENVWLPFFTATNTVGETSIPSEDLGAPLRLAKGKDGAVRFGNNGRPSVRVAANLNEHITMVRENFVAGLLTYAGSVMEEHQEGYALQVTTAQQAGAPIIEAQSRDVAQAIEQLEVAAAAEQAKAQEEAQAGEPSTESEAEQAPTPEAEEPSEATEATRRPRREQAAA